MQPLALRFAVFAALGLGATANAVPDLNTLRVSACTRLHARVRERTRIKAVRVHAITSYVQNLTRAVKTLYFMWRYSEGNWVPKIRKIELFARVARAKLALQESREIKDSHPLRRSTTVTYCIGVDSDGCQGNTCTTVVAQPGCMVIPESACFFTSGNVELCRGTTCNELCVGSDPCTGIPDSGGSCFWPEVQSINVLA
ncbi:hypothetical protein C8R45DRAFT_934554 [Mycena sanguinolenta]|nr:hypothetical protein C8R45DRAFT_934554 [Mycena sanguinolenta]